MVGRLSVLLWWGWIVISKSCKGASMKGMAKVLGQRYFMVSDLLFMRSEMVLWFLR